MLFDAIVLAGGKSSRLGGTPKAGLRFRGNSLLAATVASAVSRGARRVVVVGAADVAEIAADVEVALEHEHAGRMGSDTAGGGGEVTTVRVPGDDSDGAEAAGDDADDIARARIIVAREEPPFGGPAAGIAAGFAALEHASGGQEDSDFVLVLACDLPEVDGAVGALLAAVGEHARLDRLDTVDGADGIVAIDGGGRQQHLLAMYRTAALSVTVERHRAAGDLDGLPVRRLIEGLSLGASGVPSGSADDVDTWADAARHGIVAGAGHAGEGGEGGEGGGGGGGDGRARGPKARTPEDDAEQRAVLEQWVSRLTTELGLEELKVDVDEVLGLAGVAAHAVRRPAAPLTTFVVGYAAGLAAADGTDAAAAATRAADIARRLAAAHAADVMPQNDSADPGAGSDADADADAADVTPQNDSAGPGAGTGPGTNAEGAPKGEVGARTDTSEDRGAGATRAASAEDATATETSADGTAAGEERPQSDDDAPAAAADGGADVPRAT